MGMPEAPPPYDSISFEKEPYNNHALMTNMTKADFQSKKIPLPSTPQRDLHLTSPDEDRLSFRSIEEGSPVANGNAGGGHAVSQHRCEMKLLLIQAGTFSKILCLKM